MSSSVELINRYVKSYNDFDVDSMLECVTEDVVFENVSNTGQSMSFTGKDAMGEVARLSANAFESREQKLVQLIAGSTKAAAEVVFKGKAAVDLPNGVKAGEEVELRGASFFDIRDGRLSRIADYS